MSARVEDAARNGWYLLEVLTDHIASLEAVGFGSDDEIRGADAVDAVNAHFDQLRTALMLVQS